MDINVRCSNMIIFPVKAHVFPLLYSYKQTGYYTTGAANSIFGSTVLCPSSKNTQSKSNFHAEINTPYWDSCSPIPFYYTEWLNKDLMEIQKTSIKTTEKTNPYSILNEQQSSLICCGFKLSCKKKEICFPIQTENGLVKNHQRWFKYYNSYETE
jgi:hypothetical protein